jgi:hypothetical protein
MKLENEKLEKTIEELKKTIVKCDFDSFRMKNLSDDLRTNVNKEPEIGEGKIFTSETLVIEVVKYINIDVKYVDCFSGFDHGLKRFRMPFDLFTFFYAIDEENSGLISRVRMIREEVGIPLSEAKCVAKYILEHSFDFRDYLHERYLMKDYDGKYISIRILDEDGKILSNVALRYDEMISIYQCEDFMNRVCRIIEKLGKFSITFIEACKMISYIDANHKDFEKKIKRD